MVQGKLGKFWRKFSRKGDNRKAWNIFVDKIATFEAKKNL